jgi:hypothetical protein
MKIFRFTTLILLLLALNACDSTTKGSKKAGVAVVAGPDFPINIQKTAKYASIEEARRQAAALIDHRVDKEPKALAMVTSPYWVWGGFFDGQNMIHPDKLKGQWLKFHDDFTYTYGWFDDINGSGRYHYRLDDYSLIMLDDNEEFQPKEWQLQSNGIAIVLIGRHGFEVNNGMQMKLTPKDIQPSKASG